jgi:putative membrane protein
MIVWLFLSWVANLIILLIVTWVFSDVTYDGFWKLALAAVIFGVLNTILKPFLKLITVPIAVITLGLIWFFVSMLMLKLTDWIMGSGFDIEGFWTLVGATIVVWIVNVVLDNIPGPWRGTRS